MTLKTIIIIIEMTFVQLKEFTKSYVTTVRAQISDCFLYHVFLLVFFHILVFVALVFNNSMGHTAA